MPGLRAGAYGASFRFKTVRDSIDQAPRVSDYNPLGLPERTIREAQVFEFGPVTFGAYQGATAGARARTRERLELMPFGSEEVDTVELLRAATAGWRG